MRDIRDMTDMIDMRDMRTERDMRHMRGKIIKSFCSAFLFFIFVFLFVLISNNPEGLCYCWVVDSPSCSCFVNDGAWNPFPGYIQVVAIPTVGTRESCGIANGGKPFYQMVIGCNSFVQADAISAILMIFPIYERQAWCSETISFWHREAGIPYAGGYSTWWHADWSLRSVNQLATWYKVDLRGRWISWDDLSYSDFKPGVTIPVPGAYVATRGFTGEFLTFPVGFIPIWHGFNDSHSQMINEMWVYFDSEEKISRISVTLLEGNSDNRVRFDRSWDDLISLTPFGPDWVQDDRKIYGFGIDLDSSGQPIYDPSRLHLVYQADFNPVHLVRPLTVIDREWDSNMAPLVPDLKSYAEKVERNNGPEITSSSSLVNTEGIPDGKNTQWFFPSRLSEEVVIEIDLLEEHPLSIKGVVLNWDAGFLPQDYRIQIIDDTGRYKEGNIPDIRDLELSDDPDLFISVPVTFSSDQPPKKARYVRLIFPENTFENDAVLEEMRFIYDWGPWEDSEDHPDSKKRTISMSLPAGWSMMSLQVKPDVDYLSSLFSDAVVIYGYEKGRGYMRIKEEDDLEAGRGYWILLNEAKTSIITGEIIDEYNLTLQDGWHMIGGCTSEAQAMLDDGEIRVIYGYRQGYGYRQVPETENLEPGKGYWILVKNINDYTKLSVQGRTDCRCCSTVPYVSHHGMSSSTYQERFDEYASKGYRLTYVSGYEVSGSARFAAIWEKKSGPSWMAHHNMSSSTYQDKFDEYKDLGFRLIHVSGYTVDGTPRFAAIWEKKSGPPMIARHNMDSSTYQSEFDEYKSQGYRLMHVSGYSYNGSSRFAAIWEKEDGPPWTARHNMDSSTYQSEFDELADLGYKLSHVSGYTVNGTPRFAAIWEKKSGRYAARHGLSSTNYQNEFENYHYQGYRLLKVSGYSQGGEARYAALWKSVCMKSSDLDLINNTINPFMDNANVPGLSLAVVKDGRLVFAKGFGYADEETNEKTSPKHLFRIASISKPITSTAIMRLFEEGELDSYSAKNPSAVDGLDALAFGSNGILTEYSGFGRESYLWEVTVRHLLEHTSGAWGRDFPDPNNYTDPMSYKKELDHYDLITDVLSNTENFGGTAGKIWQQAQPGTVYSYSNFGYCILGRVIERITGMDYDQYVKDNILDDCDITDMQIAGSDEDDRVYKEVKYYAGPDNIQPYGTMNVTRMDSHGGWIASAIDLARFIIRVDDLPGKADILSQTTLQEMLTADTVGGSYAKGWRIEKVDGSPVVNKWRHSGSLPGSASRMVRNYNGFSWAILINTRIADEYNDDFADLLQTITDNVSSWPSYDLF